MTTEKSPRSALALSATILASVILGLCFRLLSYEHTTSDTFTYLLPWYQMAATLGIGSLKLGLTNYAPFYSYLLLAAVQFDGMLPPLLLIKAISYVFELGSAVIAYRLVSTATKSVWAPVFAFSATWLAPSVLFNGALWGQADSLWSFFVLLSVYLACLGRFRSACVSFSVAVSVKAQAIFLGPFVFALVLKRKVSWLWLVAIPATYAALAAPVLLLGRPPAEVFGIYQTQAETFKELSRGAANPWSFVPQELYGPGLLIGLATSAMVGLGFSVQLARKIPSTPYALIFAAAASLQLMPFVLPKMHDRYFYAFELLSIVLAGLEPKLIVVAVASQIIAVLSYLPFEFQGSWGSYLGVPLAAILNTFLLVFMQQSLWLERPPFSSPMLWKAIFFASVIYVAWCLIVLTLPTQAMLKWWPINRSDLVGLAAYLTVLAALLCLPIIRAGRRESGP